MIGLRRRRRVGNVGGLFGRIFGCHRGRHQSAGRSGLPQAGQEKPQRGRNMMSTNWAPSHPGLFGWSNAQLVSGSNTDNTSLNQQLTAAIAPCFAPASRKIPSPPRRGDEDSSGREHHTKPGPHDPQRPEGPKRSKLRPNWTLLQILAQSPLFWFVMANWMRTSHASAPARGVRDQHGRLATRTWSSFCRSAVIQA